MNDPLAYRNLQVDWQQLPAAAELPLTHVSPLYYRVIKLRWLLAFGSLLLAAALLYYFVPRLQTTAGFATGAMAWLLLTVSVVYLDLRSYRLRAFAIREKDIVYRTGWLFRRLQVVPFSRIQHCSVESGPFERKYGLASLVVFTAATGENDIAISGLPQQDAEKFRDFILGKITH